MNWKQFRMRPQIIQGMSLTTLLKVLAQNNFQVDAHYLGRLGYLLLLGAFNSVFGACETCFNSRDIEAAVPAEDPIFIVGHWRSGTTHLHNLMSQDPQLVSPTAFQCLFPGHFIFSQSGGFIFNMIAPPKRPMDNVAFSADAPHEDEFALAAHSAVSPYLNVWFPVTGGGVNASFDPQKLPTESLEKWKSSFMTLMKKLSLSENKRPIFKSPPHMGRIGLLREMFCKAKFIHIIRDPYDVYASTHKLWCDSLLYASLQKPSYEQTDETILSWYLDLFELYHRDLSLLPDNIVYEMRFEDLEARPLETLRSAYGTLGLSGWEAFEPRVSTYISTLRNYKKNEHNLTPEEKAKVAERWLRAFVRYGYSV